MTTGVPYINPADEWTNFNVPAQTALHRGNPGTNTPLTIPGGRVIGTAELDARLTGGTSGSQ